MKKSFTLAFLLVIAILASTAYAGKPQPKPDYPRTPFHNELFGSWGPGQTDPITLSFTVPADSYLVIETIAADVLAYVGGDRLSDFHISTSIAGVTAKYPLSYSHRNIGIVTISTDLYYERSGPIHNVRIYADPETDVVLYAKRWAGSYYVTNTFTFSVTISGYLVPLDSPSLSP